MAYLSLYYNLEIQYSNDAVVKRNIF